MLDHAQATSPADSPVAVLLVEDDPADAELTMRALRQGQVRGRVQHVSDGEAALDLLFGRGTHAGRPLMPLPSVVLLDLKLPLVSGVEVLRQLKEDSRTRLIPVVVLTSSAEARDLSACYALGANSYIVKPIDSELFNQTVQRLGVYWVTMNRVPYP